MSPQRSAPSSRRRSSRRPRPGGRPRLWWETWGRWPTPCPSSPSSSPPPPQPPLRAARAGKTKCKCQRGSCCQSPSAVLHNYHISFVLRNIKSSTCGVFELNTLMSSVSAAGSAGGLCSLSAACSHTVWSALLVVKSTNSIWLKSAVRWMMSWICTVCIVSVTPFRPLAVFLYRSVEVKQSSICIPSCCVVTHISASVQ